MSLKNYTVKTYHANAQLDAIQRTRPNEIIDTAFRVLNYDNYSETLKANKILDQTDHIKEYCFECSPGRIKRALESSIKIKNRGGMGKHVLNVFRANEEIYISPEEFMEKKFNHVPILWGGWRGNYAIIRMLDYFKKEYFYLDHSYSARGHQKGNYRIAISSRFASQPKEVCFDRSRFFQSQEPEKPYLLPWRKTGDHIVICPPSSNLQVWNNSLSWEENIISKLKLYTDRPILVKRKEDDDHSYFKDAWCAITDQSNVAFDALHRGIPVITIEKEVYSHAGSIGIENVEKPTMGDREYLFNWLAYNQFTAKEMKTGLAVEILSDIYG